MNGLEVAIIGMSCRFPGADSIGEYWDNLTKGVESVSFFSEEEKMKFNENLTSHSRYVNAKGGIINEPYGFDEKLFGYTPNEARLMDPQIRIMHELVWAAMEDAAYSGEDFPGRIGLFASAGQNSLWEIKAFHSKLTDSISAFASSHISQKDYIASLIAYKLNLKGPVVFLSTACSSSLVAVHLAVRALLGGECDMALAGGISVQERQSNGYIHEENMVLSSDGHCRAFDASADGTIYGQGGGVVMLKLLDAAIRDKDNILAVIKGTAVNNDGSQKIGFTAPGLLGQEAVIREALSMAGTPADTIDMVETHGTGTVIGDPIEIQALTNAYNISQKQHCAIGSVKTNIGHTDTAAGVAGLIKSILSLKHQTLVPSLHYETPNPKINFSKTPFYVNTETKEWPRKGHPRRAGVSCFGVGGTNVHMVLEEFCPATTGDIASGPFIFSISAQSEFALEQYAGNMLKHLAAAGDISMESVCYTLHTGRHHLRHRLAIAASSAEELVSKLGSSRKQFSQGLVEGSESCVLLFPGQGMQYFSIGRSLYGDVPRFRKVIDYCAASILAIQGVDIRTYINGSETDSISKKDIFRQSVAQPLIFSIEYALASVLDHWGIKPACMMGQSIGEYVAACIAGVFHLDDALRLVCIRGQLMEELPPGAMMYIPIDVDTVRTMLPIGLSIAIVNEPGCVVSGRPDDIRDFETELKKKRIMTMRLDISHAGHSFLLESMLEVYGDAVRSVKMAPPKIAFVSNKTGTWIRAEEATDPDYWIAHLTDTILLSDSIKTLCLLDNPVFIEAGPGNSLTSIAGRFHEQNMLKAVNLLLPQSQGGSETTYLKMRLAQIWVWGLPVNWRSYYGNNHQAISLPGYPFQRKKFDLDNVQFGSVKQQPKTRKPDIYSWFYLQGWRRKNLLRTGVLRKKEILVLHGDDITSKGVIDKLEENNSSVTRVAYGPAYSKSGSKEYTIGKYSDLENVFAALSFHQHLPETILYLIGDGRPATGSGEQLQWIQEEIYHATQEIARINGRRNQKVNFLLVTDSLHEVIGREQQSVTLSVLLGLMKSINQEFANLNCCNIDFVYADEEWGDITEALLNEDAAIADEKIVAYRNGIRWIQSFEALDLKKDIIQEDVFRKHGVYVLAGGLGNIGFIIAKHLAEAYSANLVIIGRRSLPPREDWEALLSSGNADPIILLRIRKIMRLEQIGAKVYYHACDVIDKQGMQMVMEESLLLRGSIDGIFYAATEIEDHQKLPISAIGKKEIDIQFHAKVHGLQILDEVIGHLSMDFCLLFSSHAAIFGGLGYSAYAAANSFMDFFAVSKRKNRNTNYISLNSTGWIYLNSDFELQRVATAEKNYKVLPEEGLEVVKMVLAVKKEPHVLVYLSDLDYQLANWVNIRKGNEPESIIKENNDICGRPELTTAYRMPETIAEKELTLIWAEILGFAELGTQDDFFELGGDSLKAIRMIARVENRLGKNISLKEFLESRTIEKISHLVESRAVNNYKIIPPAEKKQYYQLSSAQNRLYFQQKAYPESVAYNEQICLRVKGTLKPEQISSIIAAIEERHEILRTGFIEVDGVPYQRVSGKIQIPVTMLDLQDEGEGALKKAIRGFVRPFRLNEPPFMRVQLISLGNNDSILLADLHHIITDGISFNIFKREFQAMLAGTAPDNELLQYKDFSEWKHRSLQSETLKKQQMFWQNKFMDQSKFGLQLPNDDLLVATEEAGVGQVRLVMQREQAEGFRKLLSDSQVTVFNGLLSLCNILLSKVTKQEVISIISPVLGRRREELQHSLGAFINMVVFQNHPDPGMTFMSFLKKVQVDTAEVFDNDEYPFEQLVSFLKTKNKDFIAPVFDVMFTIRNLADGQPAAVSVQEQQFEYYDIEVYKAKYKLQLVFEEKKDMIELIFIYDTGHLSSVTMQMMRDWFKIIADTVTNDPHVLLGEIRLYQDMRDEQGELEGMFGSFDY